MTNATSCQWLRANPLRLEPLGQSTIAYDRLRGNTHVLQSLAAAILHELEFPATVAQLTERLALSDEQAIQISPCLNELERHDLVYRSECSY